MSNRGVVVSYIGQNVRRLCHSSVYFHGIFLFFFLVLFRSFYKIFGSEYTY